MLEKNEINRIEWVDTAKGIGMLLVIIGHIINNDYFIFKLIFSFHMPLFFFLSGYTYKPKKKNTGDSIKKIFKNLIIPYLIFVFFGLFTLLFNSATISVKQILSEIFIQGQPKSIYGAHLWFFVSLAVVQLLFIILKKNKIIIQLAFLMIGLYIAQTISGDSNSFRLPFMLDSSLVAIVFFYLGNMQGDNNTLMKIISSITNLQKSTLLFFLFIISMFFCYNNSSVNIANNEYGNILFFFLSSFAGIFFIILFATIMRRPRILHFFGRNSLPIFASHYFFLVLFAKIISLIFHSNFQIMENIPIGLSIIGFLVICVISIPFSLFYNNTIKTFINRVID